MNENTKSQFIDYFIKGIKKKDQLKVGVEHERFLFTSRDNKRIDYCTLKKLFDTGILPLNDLVPNIKSAAIS